MARFAGDFRIYHYHWPDISLFRLESIRQRPNLQRKGGLQALRQFGSVIEIRWHVVIAIPHVALLAGLCAAGRDVSV